MIREQARMGHASIVQRNWVPCAQPNFACVLVSAPVASFKVVRFRRALSSTSGLSSRFRVTNQTRLSPMKMLSPQSRYSGNSDGGESDSDGRSGWSPRDKFGLYPWDPSWDSPERDCKGNLRVSFNVVETSISYNSIFLSYM